MMALGAFRFCIDTAAYQDLRRESSYNWMEQERIGSTPLLQYTGQGSDSITLDGVIYPETKGGSGQISLMRLQADLGLPLPLISGTGNYFGLWCIAGIREGQEIFWANGRPRKQTFSIALKKYGELTLKIGPFNVSASGLLGAIL